MIEIRKRHPAFGLGDVPRAGRLEPDGAGVHAHLTGTTLVLCVNNMSRFPQPVELDLSAWQGGVPHELTGGVPFPRDR